MGPPPRSFAADAYDCIMVAILTDRPNTRLWRDLRARWRAPLELSSFGRTAGKARPTNLGCRRARDRQGQVASRWPAATLDRHCAQRPSKVRSGRGDGRQLVEQGDGKDRRSSLTIIAPYKVFGCRPLAERGRARRRPASENLQGRKPREGIRGGIVTRYGDLTAADDAAERRRDDPASWRTATRLMSKRLRRELMKVLAEFDGTLGSLSGCCRGRSRTS
jgi:hypothetical protein